MKRTPRNEFIEKAKLLSREDAEQILARMRRKLNRKLEDNKLDPLEAVAIQLEIEEEELLEWRERWTELTDREAGKKK